MRTDGHLPEDQETRADATPAWPVPDQQYKAQAEGRLPSVLHCALRRLPEAWVMTGGSRCHAADAGTRA
jgi:hypothetical protein